jgi:hypothetical protein
MGEKGGIKGVRVANCAEAVKKNEDLGFPLE